jgi:general secretion pathway protein A
MTDRLFQSLYGVTFPPFRPDIPDHAVWKTDQVESFVGRLDLLVKYGGFALISGETGLGKSRILQLIASRLRCMEGLTVGIMQRSQNTIMDFYRELGDVFGIALSPANRYGGFKSLRARWKNHLDQTLLRPVLLIDEAQEMPIICLNELRLLSSEQFDAHSLLTVVLCGDNRLVERFRDPILLPLGSRIRHRLVLHPYSRDELLAFVTHQLAQAGASHLMNEELKCALVDHAAGNLRILTNMASDLFEAAVARKLPSLDEKLFLELFTGPSTGRRTAASPARK